VRKGSRCGNLGDMTRRRNLFCPPEGFWQKWHSSAVFSTTMCCILVAWVPRQEMRDVAMLGGRRWAFGGQPAIFQEPSKPAIVPTVATLDRQGLLAAHREEIAQLRSATNSKLTDHDLLAHLRAAQLQGQDPVDRVLATMKWRKQSGIGQKAADRFWQEAEYEFRKVLKYDFLGHDLFGRPVLVERVGAWDVRQVEAAAADLERFVLLNALVCEQLVHMRRPASTSDARGVIVVLDMDGLGQGHLSSKLLRAFTAVARVIRAFYPDMLADVFVVKAPWLFSALHMAIQPVLSGRTLSGVHISTSVPTSLGNLGAACLPTDLRGIRTHVFPYDETILPTKLCG